MERLKYLLYTPREYLQTDDPRYNPGTPNMNCFDIHFS